MIPSRLLRTNLRTLQRPLVSLRFKSDTLAGDVSPHGFAKRSELPHIPNPETPNKDIDPKGKLEKPVFERGGVVTMPQWQKSLGEWMVSFFRIDMDRIRAGAISGSKYYYMCREQALQYKDEPLSESAVFWYETLGLPRTFAQWYQITVLHVWMLFVRMRAMPFKVGKNYQQKLVDRFFKDIELRLSEEMNVLSGRIRDMYLKDFHSEMMGMVCAFDEGFMSNNDSYLAYAVWRNIFNGDKNVDVVKLEAVVRYIRMQLYVLDQISDRAFGFGDFVFVSPSETVDPLTPEEVEQLKQATKKKYDPAARTLLPSERSNLSMDE